MLLDTCSSFPGVCLRLQYPSALELVPVVHTSGTYIVFCVQNPRPFVVRGGVFHTDRNTLSLAPCTDCGCRTRLCSSCSVCNSSPPTIIDQKRAMYVWPRARRTTAKTCRTPQQPVQRRRVGYPCVSAWCGPFEGAAARSTCLAPPLVSASAFRKQNKSRGAF